VKRTERNDKLDLTTFERLFCSYQWYLFCFMSHVGSMGFLWSFEHMLFRCCAERLGLVARTPRNNNRRIIPSFKSAVGVIVALISGFAVE
jgi:hypothetical protein